MANKDLESEIQDAMEILGDHLGENGAMPVEALQELETRQRYLTCGVVRGESETRRRDGEVPDSGNLALVSTRGEGV